MAYSPTNWKTGDVVTSSKLNKLEQGVVDASDSYNIPVITLTVHNDNTVTCDKSYDDLTEYLNRSICIIKIVLEDGTLIDTNICTFGNSYDQEGESVDLIMSSTYWDVSSQLMRFSVQKTRIFEDGHATLVQTDTYWSATASED